MTLKPTTGATRWPPGVRSTCGGSVGARGALGGCLGRSWAALLLNFSIVDVLAAFLPRFVQRPDLHRPRRGAEYPRRPDRDHPWSGELVDARPVRRRGILPREGRRPNHEWSRGRSGEPPARRRRAAQQHRRRPVVHRRARHDTSPRRGRRCRRGRCGGPGRGAPLSTRSRAARLRQGFLLRARGKTQRSAKKARTAPGPSEVAPT